jgi:hypothetical protein
VSFTVVRLGLFVVPVQQSIPVGDGDALPTTFADTDAVLATAESAGGSAFRSRNAGRTVAASARGTDDSAASPFAVPVWLVSYTASDTPGGPVVESFTVTIDFVTGAVLGTTAQDEQPERSAGRIELRSANPFRTTLESQITLDEPGYATVSIVDATGRTVAVLANGPRGAGPHQLRWTPGADVSSGVYWIRLEARGAVQTQAVTRLR